VTVAGWLSDVDRVPAGVGVERDIEGVTMKTIYPFFAKDATT
jgi:hypothetical protein